VQLSTTDIILCWFLDWVRKNEWIPSPLNVRPVLNEQASIQLNALLIRVWQMVYIVKVHRITLNAGGSGLNNTWNYCPPRCICGMPGKHDDCVWASARTGCNGNWDGCADVSGWPVGVNSWWNFTTDGGKRGLG
jgi:hypothetical protein